MQYRGFNLDSFQEQAVLAVDNEKSLIVSAPTGCGKTLIAEYAIERTMELGRKAIYTAPIKALSNQKFRDFRQRFGEDAVGIHTGDVSINPDAPLLIMTTEIFRNLILEQSKRLDGIYYVVFDEVHFIDDEERGTVWEESIILAPKQIRFCCLSATVPNIDELAEWMGIVRESDFVVIKETVRPVPLRHHLYSSTFGVMNLKGLRQKFKRNYAVRKKFLKRKPSSRRVIKHVLKNENVPVLYFCFNRRACERNATMHARLHLLTNDERQRLQNMVDELVHTYGLDGYERLEHMRSLWENGCAYHHAGILPAAKEIVERLFASGLIKLLFCTETFALGVNMPASSVIFDELEKFNGVEFVYLTCRQYQQMAGRAGRRGMDEEGHVYSLIIPEATDPKEVERILYGKSERIRSHFFASYATILSIYSSVGEKAYDIFSQSLRNYSHGEFSNTRSYKNAEDQIRNRIRFLQQLGFLDKTNLTSKGRLAMAVNGYEIQVAELYYSRSFDDCTPEQICVVLAAIITEERKKRNVGGGIAFRFHGEKVIRKLRNMEIKQNIKQPIRELDFSLAAPIHAWAGGCSLFELESFGVPEGDLIRLLRMVVQLLRTLRGQINDPVMREKLFDALEMINRDVVDAQAELEVQ